MERSAKSISHPSIASENNNKLMKMKILKILEKCNKDVKGVRSFNWGGQEIPDLS